MLRGLAVVHLHKQTVPSLRYYLIILLTRAKRVPESLLMVNYTIDLHFLTPVYTEARRGYW